MSKFLQGVSKITSTFFRDTKQERLKSKKERKQEDKRDLCTLKCQSARLPAGPECPESSPRIGIAPDIGINVGIGIASENNIRIST